MRESLRINSPITAIGVRAKEDTLMKGKYPVSKDDRIIMLLAQAHLDPAVFGDDANEFKPERMLDGKYEAMPVSP